MKKYTFLIILMAAGMGMMAVFFGSNVMKMAIPIQDYDIFVDPIIDKQNLFDIGRVTLQNTCLKPITNIHVNFGDGDTLDLKILVPGDKILLLLSSKNSMKYVMISVDNEIFVSKAYRTPPKMVGMIGSSNFRAVKSYLFLEILMKFLTSGKVKDLYENDENTLIFKFSDRVSAYDVKFKQSIPKKGEVLCKFAEFWFNELTIDNHFVKRLSDTEILVKKMDMLPIECVVRGYFYGSLVSRWEKNNFHLSEDTDTRLAAKLPKPIFDPTTKSEHDIPIDKTKAIEMNLVTEEQYCWLEKTSIDIYKKMAEIADTAGFILADLKLEFGLLDGHITLGDSIGPDECRLWPKDSYAVGKIQDAYDKQLLRDWLDANGYQKQFDDARIVGRDPVAPTIPEDIIQKMTERYTAVFDRITGSSL